MVISTSFPNETATVGGQSFATSGTFDVINPATGLSFAQAPNVTADQLDDVFEAALFAFSSWRRDDDERRAYLHRAADAICEATEELARLLTSEQGKPLNDARREISTSVSWLRYYADLDVPRQVIRDDDEAYEEVFRRPIGVVSAITPWNFPLTLAMWKIAPALRAGNTMVIKPSPYTPLATLALGRLLRGVLPDGVLNVVSGLDPLGSGMTLHPIPRKISFTGSTTVGKLVAAGAAPDLKRLTLELGGNDPAIVLGDVNVADIADSLFWGGFNNNGQICVAVKRVYAHAAIHDELVEALREIARSTLVGDGMVPGVRLGPVNNRTQFEIVKELAADAVAHGGRILAGGLPLDREGYFFPPTVVDRVHDGMRLVDEEQFGPVMPIVNFTDEAQIIDMVNRGPYGLTASVWSADVDHALVLAAQIDSGQVAINRHGRGVLPHLPFSGHRLSGLGVENGMWGLDSYTELQTIAAPPRNTRNSA
ncbi:aldehyde dehydrogenase [Paenarthrobacter nitroguajacolicus]|uniref:aldehyde dehydrogenase family protein n=1 Tax=Paenarthrobacter nitroguajacolicus TaxID=211146 RepID=UPI0015B7D833|nr:aldehyde dehydrogenase family protein [Paenarthrobacter nitroguajacolicus]NWL10287.1 aldehyde dehydrogenase [Paenarthrobacter nitroguajacolicus]